MNENHELKKAAAAEINRLAKAGGGRITPEALVQAAADENSPLHGYFEWNDTDAAAKYRLMQARTLIRSCSVIVKIESRKVPIPMYIRDPDMDSQAQGYVETARIRTDADAAHEALTREFSRAASMIHRARRLAAFFDMADEFDELAERLTAIKTRIDEKVTLHDA
jgi:hypothetical protein